MKTLIALILFFSLFAGSAFAVDPYVARPEIPGNGIDDDRDGTIDNAPSDCWTASGSDYTCEAESAQFLTPAATASDSGASGGSYLGVPVGKGLYDGVRIRLPGTIGAGTYYLHALVRVPSGPKKIWWDNGAVGAYPNNATQGASLQQSATFACVALGTAGTDANLNAGTNATAARPVVNPTGIEILSSGGIDWDKFYLSTDANKDCAAIDATAGPTADYIITTAQATPPADASDASWAQANILNWQGYNSTSIAAPTLKLQWKSGSPSLLYGLITVPDTNIVTTVTANDDDAIFNGGDDYFEFRITPSLTRTPAGSWKIAINAASSPAVWDAVMDAADNPDKSYSASCTRSRTVNAGVSWTIFFICNIGFTPAANSYALFQMLLVDVTPSYTYRIAFGPGMWDTNEPLKWGVVKYSSTVTPAPPPDTTAPTVTNPGAINVGTVSADIQATSNEAGTGKVRYGTATKTYTSTSSTTNCPASVCTINLTGLTANTPYYYVFDVTDAAGNTGTTTPEASFTTAAGNTFYISTTGSGTTCSSGSPCAQSRLTTAGVVQPGDTWKLKNGTYSPISISCPTVANGTVSQPITIQAENERQAEILGTGNEQAALQISNCAYWTVNGLHLEQQDYAGTTTDSNIFECDSCQNLTFTRNILNHNNRLRIPTVGGSRADGAVFYQSTNVTVTENELYNNSILGFSFFYVTGGYVARNYANKGPDVADTWNGTHAAFECYPCNNITFANNIAEGWLNNSGGGGGAGVGFDVQSTGPASGIKFLGNIAFNGNYGMTIGPRSGTDDPSVTIQNQANINNATTEFVFGSPGNVTCQNCSGLAPASPILGVTFQCKVAGGSAPYSCGATNTLLTAGAATFYGFEINSGNAASYSGTFDHDNVYNHYNSVWGTGITHTNITTADPGLGACKIFIPDGTAMKGIGTGGADIGANVLYQYDSTGSLTSTKLWNATTGHPAFAGATVTGLNDVAGSSLINVDERLNINQGGCSYPTAYAAAPITYYVAKTGNDSNSCAQALSASTPKLTITAALACVGSAGTDAGAGYIVQVADGTYDETLIDKIPSGLSWSSPFTLKSASPYGAVIRPTSNNVVSITTNSHYVIIDGFTIDGGGQSGGTISASHYNASDFHHTRILNNEIKNSAVDCIATGLASFLEITNNIIHDCALLDPTGHSHGIYARITDSLIERNTIYNVANGYGLHFYNNFGGAGMDSNIVRSNIIHDIGATNGQAAILASGSNMQIYNNLMYSNANGIWATQGGSNIYVYNNTIYGNASYGFLNTTVTGVTATNNIAYSNATADISGTVTQSHNLCGSGCTGTGSINGSDPLFVNSGAGNFHLQAGSPARNAGTNLSSVFTTDLAGTTRTLPFDIGAYEYVP